MITICEGATNNQRLRRTIANYGIARNWVAESLYVNPSTVDRWLQPRTRNGMRNSSYRAMPDSALKLFEYSLGDASLPYPTPT